MPTYKTPGVFVEEISTLPPSVAEVSTAIPAFIGCTEKGPKLARINTMLEYRELFGSASPTDFTVTTATDTSGATTVQPLAPTGAGKHPAFLLYYCLEMYFRNGGGSCYVASVGNYSAQPSVKAFTDAIDSLEKEDEPTLIVLTDAVNQAKADDYYAVCNKALDHCGKMKDRFAILDVLTGDSKGAAFRDKVISNHLMYGAAYTPYLQTDLNYVFDETKVNISGGGAASTPIWEATHGSIVVRYQGSGTPEVKITNGAAATAVSFVADVARLTISDVNTKTGDVVVTAWQAFAAANDTRGFTVTGASPSSATVPHTATASVPLTQQPGGSGASETLASIKSKKTALYQQVKAALAKERVVLPPSAAVAGIYASVDRDRGVWKAPANVSISGVIAPMEKITQGDQENLNVDPTAGKSINAVRFFTGSGALVWGARTLAGNDNEWRYIPVRRLFNMIEESTQKATAFAVFEPNDATTWLKVKGMIESYLYGLWEQGALAGATSDSSYFVNIGLGKTMTAQDVLEGRMNVEIGIAAVRPAEFIVLRFTHKLQEA